VLLDRIRVPTLFVAALSMALIAGFFYAYACSVMLGLARLDSAGFIATMQAINATVRNGAFASSFFGSLLFTGIAVLCFLPRWRGRPAQLIGLAFLTYALGGFGVTFAYSVPLNESLARVSVADPAVDLDAVRRAYVDPWIRWNIVRTVASTGAFLLLCGAIFLTGREARGREKQPSGARSSAIPRGEPSTVRN
jgi:uncharacterized membrane protein